MANENPRRSEVDDKADATDDICAANRARGSALQVLLHRGEERGLPAREQAALDALKKRE